MDVFELLDSEYDICKQVEGLNTMIFREKPIFVYNSYTIADVFEKKLLRAWESAKGRISFEELLTDLKLYDNYKIIKPVENEQEALICFQLDYNIISYAMNNEHVFLDYNYNPRHFFQEFDRKSLYIFDKAGLQAVKHPQKDYYLIVPNDEKVRSVAENTDKDIAFLLFNYSSPLVKGNYQKKREILKLITNKIEPLIKEYKNKYTNGLGHEIFDDLGNLINNFEIRHSNLDVHISKSYNEFLTNYTAKEWEEVYDATYQLILDAFLIDNYKNIYSPIIKKHTERIAKH